MVEEQMSKEELIGFHKGALNTLGNEKAELIKMIGNVDLVIQAHMKALKDLGVDLEAAAKKAQEAAQKQADDTSLSERVA
jgi:hypothetical protein